MQWKASGGGGGQRAPGVFQKLPVLPAVLVCGHQWSFAATRGEGRKTVLWLKWELVSAMSPLGVYEVVWGLQRIAKWAADVY